MSDILAHTTCDLLSLDFKRALRISNHLKVRRSMEVPLMFGWSLYYYHILEALC
jgi:hypothetical protein